jgi:fido (protein-threonine AMPylation protein)
MGSFSSGRPRPPRAGDLAELERLEGPLVLLRRVQIDAGPGPAGQFDADHLKALHRFLFQDVFEWAGHTRNERVRLSDGTTATEPLMQKVGGTSFNDKQDCAHVDIFLEESRRFASVTHGTRGGRTLL